MGFFNGQIKNPAITPQANNNGGFFRSYGMPVIGPKFVPGTEKKTLGKKVIGFGQDFAKDALGTLLVKPAARATEAITRVAFPDSLAAKGYEAMANEGQTQSFNIPGLNKVLGGPIDVEQQKAFGEGGATQILGQALHSAAYLAPYGKIGSFFGARAFPMGAKVTAENIAKYKLLGEAAAGGLGGGAFGGGAAMEQGLPAGEVLKQTAIGAGLGAATPFAFEGIKKLVKGKTKLPTNIEEAVTKEAIPAVEDVISKTKGETLSEVSAAKVEPKINVTDKEVSAFDDFFKDTGDTPEDRVYKKSTISNWINKAEEAKQTRNTDELIDIVQKRPGTTEIEGLPNEALRKVLQRDKTLTDAQKYRLKNTLSGSESGADLRAMQIDNNGIINNEFDYAKSVEAKMREKLNDAKVTNKTISRFLDDIECK